MNLENELRLSAEAPPIWQSRESVREIFDDLTVGDVVNINLRGNKKKIYDLSGIHMFRGAVQEISEERGATFYNYFLDPETNLAKYDSARTLTLEDIGTIQRTPAEVYISEKTGGRFNQWDVLIVKTEKGIEEMYLALIHEEEVMGITEDEEKIMLTLDILNNF